MDQSDLPPEILARAFELGIHAWGIQFLGPLSRVCRHWQEIIKTTPRLWGIIVVPNKSPTFSFESQINKAKESPLSITISSRLKGRHGPVINRLISLSHNWINADVTTTTLARCRWADLCAKLEGLRLLRGREDDSQDFFGDTQTQIKLRSFTAVGLPKSWILGFLGPSIRYFCFQNSYDNEELYGNDIFQYLYRINEAVVIELEYLYYRNLSLPISDIAHFNNLQTLRLSGVSHTPTILCSISAPSLQTLVIEHAWGANISSMAQFFSQWSQPRFVPVNLHTLELLSCLKVTDVPFLIRWLARLPNIVRLILRDDAIGQAATTLGQTTDHADLYKALASPLSLASISNGWLCPSLMILHLETDQVVADLIPIARARGGRASPDFGIPLPSRLRRIEAILCSSSEPGERELLDSLVDHANCLCIFCGLTLELVV